MSAYFTKPDPLARFVLARAVDINSRMDAVEAGFDNVFVAVESLGNSIFAAVAEAMGYAAAASDSADEAAASVASIGSSVSDAAAAASTATTQAGIATTQAGIATTQAGLADTARIAAETAETNAETAETNAENARDLAQEWSSKAEDSAITGNPGFYSALHHAAKAAASASSASSSASTATTQAGLAAAAKTAAETAETNAETAETNAETAATLAGEWATKAEDSAVTGYPGQYSALHWAAKAAASAAAAATWDPANYLPLTAGSGKALTGDLFFSGTGLRIKGDFSNATIANRAHFQTSTTDGHTSVGALPNGTGGQAQFISVNNSTPTNAAYMMTGVNGSEAYLIASRLGAGTALPLSIRTGDSLAERINITTDGNVTVNAPSSGYGLQSNGPVAIYDTTDGLVVRNGDGNKVMNVTFPIAGNEATFSIPAAYTNGSFLFTSYGDELFRMTRSQLSAYRTLVVSRTTANSAMNVEANSGYERGIYFRTGTSNRWYLQGASNGAESGSDAGSDFGIHRYTDAGAWVDAPLTITRSSGKVSLFGPLYAKSLSTWQNVASATTPSLNVSSNLINITGTTTIAGFTGGTAGMLKLIRFAGALTLQYGVSLNLPGQASITTAAGDEGIFICEPNGTDWKCISFTRLNGGPTPETLIAQKTFAVAEYDAGNSGTSITLYMNRQNQKLTLTGNLSSLTFASPVGGTVVRLKIVQGSGPYTITWPSGIKWKGSTAPTLSTGNGDIDIVTFYYDGSSYHGVHDADFAAP